MSPARAIEKSAVAGRSPRLVHSQPKPTDAHRLATLAIETVAEHLVTTHVHDNAGKRDDHLVPFDGRIDWNGALTTMQKVGYDGTYLMEVANTGSPASS